MPSCRVRVPGSSANLGPGFDSFAAALSLHLELEVVKTGSFAVQTDLPIATDRRNLVVRGFAALLPADELRVHDPVARSRRRGGLGTSAAAYVAGLVAANYLFELAAPTCWRSRRSSRAIPTTSPRRCSAGSSCAPTGWRPG